jgi:hypothetical protein
MGENTPDSPYGLPGVAEYYHCFFVEQLLIPKMAYPGQKPTAPVTSGSTPIQPHKPIVPVAASVIKTKPAITRNARSIVLSLIFILISLEQVKRSTD